VNVEQMRKQNIVNRPSALDAVEDYLIKATLGITGWLCLRVQIDGTVRHLDVGSTYPGAGEGPKGMAVRHLKSYASWVQTVEKQILSAFAFQPSESLEGNENYGQQNFKTVIKVFSKKIPTTNSRRSWKEIFRKAVDYIGEVRRKMRG
jgi:hypothetical protein